MAQCHAERRKHPSAMDLYVGALHSKLYSSKRDVGQYSQWPSNANTVGTRPSPSFCKVPCAGSGPPHFGGSFREGTLMVGPSSEGKALSSLSSGTAPEHKHAEVKDSHVLTALPHIGSDISLQRVCNSTTSDVASMGKESTSSSMKVSIVSNTKVDKQDHRDIASRIVTEQSVLKERSQHNFDSGSVVGKGITKGASAGIYACKPIAGVSHVDSTLASDVNTKEQSVSYPRSHKSAELLPPSMSKAGLKAGNMHAACRLHKSGELMTSKFVGSVDVLCTMGVSATGKEDGMKATSMQGSSDGGSPLAKKVQVDDAKDVDEHMSISNTLNNKDGAAVRGFGNILVGANSQGTGKEKCSNNKTGGSNGKLGERSCKKVEEVVPMLDSACARGSMVSNVCVDGVLAHGQSSLCHGNWNISLPSGHNGIVPNTHVKQFEETKNGSILADAEDIKNAGNVQYKLGHFSEAVAFYDKSIAMCPYHAPYRSNRAAALAGLGRLGEAVLTCEEAIKLDPQYVRAHQRAAHLYLRLGLIESAKRHYKAVLTKDDAGIEQALLVVERLISICIEARKVGDWRSVLRESSAAIVAGADSAAQVLGYKAEALLNLHRVAEADALCAEAQRQESSLQKLGLAPADSFLHILRAHIEMCLGRFEGAIGAAATASKIDPRNAEAIGLLKKARVVSETRISGNKLFKLGRFFEACAAYGEGLESDPTNAVLFCNRAACRSKLGQWEKAIEDCDAALTAQPNYIKALMRRAHCSLKLERWDDALQDYEVLRVKMPSDMEVARGYFDVQVAIKKSRGEETHRMKFGREVEEVFNADQLREVVTFAGISVVQFITRWSDRCCQLSPFIEQLCKRFPCVHFVKVDVEENPHIAKVESVTLVPTFKIYKSGQRVKELQGPSEQALEHAVKHYSL